MDDFVSRKSVLDIFRRIEIQIGRGTGRRLTFRKIIEKIDEIPAADVVPVRRGKWKWNVENRQIHGWYFEFYICSCCGYELPMKYKFCPNCGADMREV